MSATDPVTAPAASVVGDPDAAVLQGGCKVLQLLFRLFLRLVPAVSLTGVADLAKVSLALRSWPLAYGRLCNAPRLVSAAPAVTT